MAKRDDRNSKQKKKMSKKEKKQQTHLKLVQGKKSNNVEKINDYTNGNHKKSAWSFKVYFIIYGQAE